MPAILAYDGKAPRLAASVFLADGSVVTGDVEIGAESSLWFGTVVRGDVNHVRIGARTNLQDHVVVHVTAGTHPTVIGDDVTVGHRAVVHGCTVNDRCLVGIGAIVMDGARIGAQSLVAAGALVSPGTIIPPRSLVMGVPAKVKRPLTDEEVAGLAQFWKNYIEYTKEYKEEQAAGSRQ